MPTGVSAGGGRSLRALQARARGVINIEGSTDIRSLHARLAANARWAQAGTEARSAQGRAGQAGLEARLLREIDPDGTLPGEERAKRLKNARAAHFARLALTKAKRARQRRESASKDAKKGAGSAAATGDPAGGTAQRVITTTEESQ